MNYISVKMWVVLKSNKYRKPLLYPRLCNCSLWTTIPFSTNYCSLTLHVLKVFDSHIAVFNNLYNLMFSVAHNSSIINITETLLWLQATYYAKNVSKMYQRLIIDHWSVCMAKCTVNPIECNISSDIVQRISAFTSEINLVIEEWSSFVLSKPFAVCKKHVYGPQFILWQMHSHWQPVVKD